MKKVITYGTYDLLHHGHIRLLERAKALGDYLIVGVTSDDFDRQRGKINVQQTLEERVAAVRDTGIADKIIIEEYEGQKIDDINRFDVDVFTVGSDWDGHFDYLRDYCEVVYLPRTKGVSSTTIRGTQRSLRIGFVGYSPYLDRVFKECSYVNGANVTALYATDTSKLGNELLDAVEVSEDYDRFLETVDAIYVHSRPDQHYEQVKQALMAGKHVMCEAPLAESAPKCADLFRIAHENDLVLMDSLRTAYSTAYARMLLLIKGGRIGNVVSVDATCTSLNTNKGLEEREDLYWGSMTNWGPTAMLPIFHILGTSYNDLSIVSMCTPDDNRLDHFSEIRFLYPGAIATAKVGSGVKSEGNLIISGTKGYVYVPAPWWKTEYFEIRYEDPSENRRYFYQLDGEGIRHEWVAFLKMIHMLEEGNSSSSDNNIDEEITIAVCQVIGQFEAGKNTHYLQENR